MSSKRAKLSRRRLLLAGGVACAVSAFPAMRLLADRGGAIRRMIQAHVGGAPIADGAIDAFVDDFLAHRSISEQGVAIDTACRLLGIDDASQACMNNADYMRRVEERIIDLFVRSTDLFISDRRDGDPIRYVAFWDPYSDSCRNPFADLSPPA
jgi:hypothetical protein